MSCACIPIKHALFRDEKWKLECTEIVFHSWYLWSLMCMLSIIMEAFVLGGLRFKGAIVWGKGKSSGALVMEPIH